MSIKYIPTNILRDKYVQHILIKVCATGKHRHEQATKGQASWLH